MARSLWKGPASPLTIDRRVARAWVILPHWVGKRVQVHQGKGWLPLHITEDMIGHRCGEFVWTRRKAKHKRKK